VSGAKQGRGTVQIVYHRCTGIFTPCACASVVGIVAVYSRLSLVKWFYSPHVQLLIILLSHNSLSTNVSICWIVGTYAKITIFLAKFTDMRC
jgi:hypothetical protein